MEAQRIWSGLGNRWVVVLRSAHAGAVGEALQKQRRRECARRHFVLNYGKTICLCDRGEGHGDRDGHLSCRD